MKKGMVLVGGYGDATFEQVLRKHKDAGFDGVEVVAADEGGWFHLNSTPEDVAALRAASQRAGVEIGSVMAGAWKNPLSHPDPKVREKGQALVSKAIEGAKGMGAAAVLVVPAVVNEEVTYEQAWARSQGVLRELVPAAERAGVCLCIENVWNKFLLSPVDFCRYVDEFQSDAVRAYFDVGNVLVYGYPEHWIRSLGRRIRKIHLKDFKTGIGNVTGFTYLLQGDVNWPKVMGAIREIGYDDYLTGEFGVYRNAPEVMLRHTSAAMDAILKM